MGCKGSRVRIPPPRPVNQGVPVTSWKPFLFVVENFRKSAQQSARQIGRPGSALHYPRPLRQYHPRLEQGVDLGFLDRREIELLQHPARLEVADQQGIGRVAEKAAGGVVADYAKQIPLDCAGCSGKLPHIVTCE